MNYIHRAQRAFRRRTPIHRVSSLLETKPHRMRSEHWFLNQVLEVCPGWTDLEDLRDWIDRTERSLGRRRNETGRDRTIDIDLLFWGDRVASEPLTVPHPRLQERAFVLDPLVEIAPDFVHPGLDRTVRQLQHELRDLPQGSQLEREESG